MAAGAPGASSAGPSGRPRNIETPMVKKKITGNICPLGARRGAVPSEIHGNRAGKRGDFRKGVGALCTHGPKVRNRERAIGPGTIAEGTMPDEVRIFFVGLPAEDEEMLRIGDGDGAEHDAVDDGEDGGVGADAEGEGEYDDGGEERGFADAAEGEAEILDEVVEPGDGPDLARVFHHAGDVAEFAHSGVAGLLGRHAASDVVLRFDFDVILNVGFEIGEMTLAIAATHDYFSCLAGRRMRAMAPANLSHLRVSRSSWARPLAVSE